MDKFSSESAMGKMYGVKSIDAFEPYFDYSILIDGDKKTINQDLGNGITLSEIIIGKNGLINGSSVAIVCNGVASGDIKVDIYIINKDGGIINTDGNSGLGKNTYAVNRINGDVIIGFTAKTNPNEIKSIKINNKIVDLK